MKDKPQIVPKPFITESYVIKDSNGVAQIRIEACGNIRGLDDILCFIKSAEIEVK